MDIFSYELGKKSGGGSGGGGNTLVIELPTSLINEAVSDGVFANPEGTSDEIAVYNNIVEVVNNENLLKSLVLYTDGIHTAPLNITKTQEYGTSFSGYFDIQYSTKTGYAIVIEPYSEGGANGYLISIAP